MKVKYANFDLVMHTLISAMRNLRKMGQDNLADIVKYIAEELQKSQNELLEDAVPAKEYDLLVRRLEHLLESDYIRSFDEKDFMTGRYKRDIREADTAPVHGRWDKAHGMMPPEYHHRKCCSVCGGFALQDYYGRERLTHHCPYCGANMTEVDGNE